MGIDIYARWRGMNDADVTAQLTGFSAVAGHVGYLREAYHGGPYVTKFLLNEAFEARYDEGAKIPAAVLRERLPAAVLMALYREHKVYGNKPYSGLIELGGDQAPDVRAAIEHIFAVEISDTSHESFAAPLDERTLRTARLLIEAGLLPDYAQAFVNFVALCEAKETESGEPCEIVASY